MRIVRDERIESLAKKIATKKKVATIKVSIVKLHSSNFGVIAGL